MSVPSSIECSVHVSLCCLVNGVQVPGVSDLYLVMFSCYVLTIGFNLSTSLFSMCQQCRVETGMSLDEICLALDVCCDECNYLSTWIIVIIPVVVMIITPV